MRSSVKRWLREPLLQFLVAGALLFAGYRALHPEVSRTTGRQSHRGDGGRSSSARDRRGPRNGAGRRRPMRCAGWSTRESARRFFTAKRWLSASTRATPSSSAGWRRKWSSSPAMSRRCPIRPQRNCARGTRATRERFAEPGRRSFRHVYFSTDRRGAQARVDAANALRELSGKPADAPAADNVGRRLHVPKSVRRSRTRTDRFDIRQRVRCRSRSASHRGPGKAPSSRAWVGISSS